MTPGQRTTNPAQHTQLGYPASMRKFSCVPSCYLRRSPKKIQSILRIHRVLVGQIPGLSLFIASPLHYYIVFFFTPFSLSIPLYIFASRPVSFFFLIRGLHARSSEGEGRAWEGWGAHRDRRECGKLYIIL